ncbi:LPXTG cell wall anchor domain-containing protein [Streptococcus parasanguinis]|uniref:LPXTG cell wall anchor domain-containing protein n=1 Tax=Streptococcus parasanguinis TaxID=1318 RepID=UPI0027E33E04|nr:LPXTG cell wall anchor domain-containing protein [Streptococcus parasanguinis]
MSQSQSGSTSGSGSYSNSMSQSISHSESLSASESASGSQKHSQSVVLPNTGESGSVTSALLGVVTGLAGIAGLTRRKKKGN